MDAANWHLVISHFPVVLAVIGTLTALLAFGLQRRGLWVFAAAALTIAGVMIYPALLTGERSQDAVTRRWYASRDAILQHERAGQLATWLTLVAGLVAAYAWYRAARRPRHREDRFPAPLQLVLALAGLAASGSLLYATWQSTFIVHRSAAPPGSVPGVRAQPTTTTPPPPSSSVPDPGPTP